MSSCKGDDGREPAEMQRGRRLSASALGLAPRDPFHRQDCLIPVENKRAVGRRADDKGLETIVAGEVVLLASTVHSPTILIAFGH